MANRGEVPNHPVDEAAQHIVIGQANVPGHRYHLHLHLLDAARGLMLLGAVAAVSAVGNPDADAAQVLLGFITWLLGVGLLSLVPVAGRFPHQLDAPRALMLLGAVAVVSGNPDADAAQVLLGFITWLLGVGLLSLMELK